MENFGFIKNNVQTFIENKTCRPNVGLFSRHCLTNQINNMFTTENHERIFARGGFKDIRSYRYWNPKTCAVDIDGMLLDLENADDGSAVLLHTCAHNPTGCDPTDSQWISIANTIEV